MMLMEEIRLTPFLFVSNKQKIRMAMIYNFYFVFSNVPKACSLFGFEKCMNHILYILRVVIMPYQIHIIFVRHSFSSWRICPTAPLSYKSIWFLTSHYAFCFFSMISNFWHTPVWLYIQNLVQIFSSKRLR